MIGLADMVRRLAPAAGHLPEWRRMQLIEAATLFVSEQIGRSHWPVRLGATLLGPLAALLLRMGMPAAALFRLGPVGACARLVSTLLLLFWFDHPLMSDRKGEEA